MCGIAGIINFNNLKPEELQLRKMMSQIKHRGPDDEGVYIDKNIGLGFVRLSIIDMSYSGHQPKESLDGRYVVIFNGEIYNYIEIREQLAKEGVKFQTATDTEVLLNSFIHWGEACLDKFNGMWAFVIYDKKENTIFASRDRFGIKPFYYIHQNNQFVFCSEIPPLLSFLGNKIEANYQSIFDYLVFNRTDQNQTTFFANVKKLQHGQCLKIENKEVTIYNWYKLRDKVKQSEGFKSADEFKTCFEAAVKLRLRSDVPIGVCLSGGLDSSSIVSTLTNILGVKNLNTFSAVYEKGETGDETEFIKMYEKTVEHMHYVTPNAESLQNDLYDFIKTHAEPIPSTSPYAQYKVMQLAKGKVVVTLDGQGADEHLAGYHYFFGFYFKDLFRHFKWITLLQEIYYYLKIHKSTYALKTFVFFLLPNSFKTKGRINEKKYLNKDFKLKYSSGNGIVSSLYSSAGLEEALLDHFEFKLEHLLKWEDRNSMRFSLEARVPFLDFNLVEKSLATAGNRKIKKGTTKFILREAMKNVLPEKIRLRQDKIGFGTPQDKWFRNTEWQKIVNDILNSSSFANRNIIDVSKAKEQFQKHVNGKINIANEIWKWVHLELWFREFIDMKTSK